ncbi:MAG: hypothetical protein Ct9H300mP14_08870 [Gammaproteobacteria bacterium]|nr:MAG: hypothetical protein Ct9H300mP14_08870 [Gammaproteobacteria bacterium]
MMNRNPRLLPRFGLLTTKRLPRKSSISRLRHHQILKTHWVDNDSNTAVIKLKVIPSCFLFKLKSVLKARTTPTLDIDPKQQIWVILGRDQIRELVYGLSEIWIFVVTVFKGAMIQVVAILQPITPYIQTFYQRPHLAATVFGFGRQKQHSGSFVLF